MLNFLLIFIKKTKAQTFWDLNDCPGYAYWIRNIYQSVMLFEMNFLEIGKEILYAIWNENTRFINND